MKKIILMLSLCVSAFCTPIKLSDFTEEERTLYIFDRTLKFQVSNFIYTNLVNTIPDRFVFVVEGDERYISKIGFLADIFCMDSTKWYSINDSASSEYTNLVSENSKVIVIERQDNPRSSYFSMDSIRLENYYKRVRERVNKDLAPYLKNKQDIIVYEMLSDIYFDDAEVVYDWASKNGYDVASRYAGSGVKFKDYMYVENYKDNLDLYRLILYKKDIIIKVPNGSFYELKD